MGPVELATNSFGQGFNATAIQVAAAFCSVVNGGSYYQPHMVSQISTESGSIVETMESELMRTTVSQETSEFIKDALLKTVGEYQSDGSLLQGSGSYAYIEGYTIAGKTGTAEKRPLTDGKCTVSFLSCAPAENPEVVVYVVIDEPQTADQGVSSLATIMSRKIYEELLPYLQIFSDSASDTDETETETETTQSETAESETSESETGESETGTDESTGSSSSVTTSGSSTFVWPHLTDEEKNQVILEYLGMSNSVESRSDVRPGAETVEEMRAQEAAEAEAETGESESQTGESETGESETDESQSDESETDESQTDESQSDE